MSKTLKLSIMIMISLIACSKGVAWSNTDILIAKDSTKTLQMEISLPATQFLLGEPVLLQVILKNIGKDPIRLPYSFSLSPPYLTYTIDGPKKPSNLYYPYYPQEADRYPNEKRSHLLEPGDEETMTFNLVQCDIVKIGHYEVNVVYNGCPYNKPLVPPFFEGKLEAKLGFDVLQPTGEDAAFLASLQSWFDIKKIEPKYRCYYHILFPGGIDCGDDIFKKYPTSRLSAWILISEIMIPPIQIPKESLHNLLYSNAWWRDYICDLSSPGGKKRLDHQDKWFAKLNWENETIDDILSRYPSAPFSASLAIQKALNLIALKDEANGLKLLGKFIQECNDRKIISRECNWAKEFIELWAQRKQTK